MEEIEICDNECLGLNEANSTNENLHLYPNPSNGWVQIEGSMVVDKVEVHSLLGNVVYKSHLSYKDQQLNLSFLADGNYVVKFYQNEQMVATKRLSLIK